MAELSRRLITARDANETVYAIEVIEADRWDEAFLHHDRAEADVRIVQLRGGEPPDSLPAWLAVEMLPHRVAEATAAYATAPAAASLAATLWPRSPSHRGPGASLDEFIGAGAEALRYPNSTPVDRRRRLLIVRDFAAGRGDPLHRIAELDGELLECLLRIVFETPQRFAEQLAVERIAAEGAREVSEVLHFLAGAEVASGPGFGELAIDRRVLREQASPWRYLDGKPFTSALAAAQEAWQRRYRVAYQAHYQSVIARADDLRVRLDHAS
jgi:hypothetical protein